MKNVLAAKKKKKPAAKGAAKMKNPFAPKAGKKKKEPTVEDYAKGEV